jgi:hypothetical protein
MGYGTGWSPPHSTAGTAPASASTPTTDVQVFNAGLAQTWTKPAGTPKWTEMYIISAGQGGGSGRRGPAGEASVGGGGGASGSALRVVFRTSDLPPTLSVDVGAGGAGGAAVTTDSTNGNPGTAALAGQSKVYSGTTIYGFAQGSGSRNPSAAVVAGAAVRTHPARPARVRTGKTMAGVAVVAARRAMGITRARVVMARPASSSS